MTSQVCSRRRDLSQSRRDPGIPGLLKVPTWNQYLKSHVYGSRIWCSRSSGFETFQKSEPCFRTGFPKFISLLLGIRTCWNMIFGSYETTKFLGVYNIYFVHATLSWTFSESALISFKIRRLFDLQFPGFVPSCVCVCPRLFLRFSVFYSAGGARTFGESCANEDTHHWLCKRTCRHAMGIVVCSLGANINF